MTVARPALSVRTVVLLFVAGLVTYVAGFSAYLTLGVAPAADQLRRGSVAVYALLGELNDRAAELAGVLSRAAEPVPATAAARVAYAGALRTALDRVAGRVAATRYADVPDSMRAPLAQADQGLDLMFNRLREYEVLVAAGRLTAAADRRAQAGILDMEVRRALSTAQQLGLGDLVTREHALSRTVGLQVRVAYVWVLGGLALVPLLWLALRARLTRPLNRLEEALAQLGRGELGQQLPVDRLDELGHLTQHFNETTEHLRHRAELQGRFIAAGELLAGVAHEVNNPLMAITTLATAAGNDPALSPTYRQDLEQILRQARRAGRLVRGLLRFIRPRDATSRPVNLNQVVEDALELVAFRFPAEEIDLESQLARPLPSVQSDPGRLEQVLVNLISNAADELLHVPRPRHLTIQTWRDHDMVCVAVADNGRGIPPEMMGRLFRPFASTKGQRGTGLGLYISRLVMREAGGELIVDPDHGEGTRFVCRLPAALDAVAAETDASPPGGRTDLTGLRLLVVDDEEVIRDSLARFLRHGGAQVAVAGDGLAGLEAAEREPFDVILADVAMPKLDGLELHAALASRRPALASRVLLLSGGFQIEEGTHLDLPMDRVLLKPIDLHALAAKIRAVHDEAPAPDAEERGDSRTVPS